MTRFFIGTYTSGSSRGIYSAVLNSQTGQMEDLQLAAELDNPAFLTVSPSQAQLFVCSEIRRDGRREGAKVVAFEVAAEGGLKPLNSEATGGQGPCYVSTDATGQVALVAHYASGSVVALPLDERGHLKPVSILIQHTGRGPRSDRQDGPHAHCIVAAPGNRYACAVDLGLDRVFCYGLDLAAGRLAPSPQEIYEAQAGSGPRHLVFHPQAPFAFLIHELDNTLALLSWEAEIGRLARLQTIGTLPDGWRGESTAGEVLVHPNGRFVYGSNRGHDSLVMFEFDAQSRGLKLLQHISTAGKTPRNFRLDPTGQYLLAANQDSDSIVSFRIDSATGLLSNTGHTLSVGSPSCIKFCDA